MKRTETSPAGGVLFSQGAQIFFTQSIRAQKTLGHVKNGTRARSGARWERPGPTSRQYTSDRHALCTSERAE